MPLLPPLRAQAKNILVAVGGKATKLDIPGADLCITSDEALELPALPKKVTIIGGGYIALEFGGIFKRFGSEVHIAYRQALPLRGFDEEVGLWRSLGASECYTAATFTISWSLLCSMHYGKWHTVSQMNW